MEKVPGKEPDFLTDGKYCPRCGETVTPADLEVFPYCPYCNLKFSDGPQLEEFVLRPVLTRWMAHHVQQFPR